MLKGILFSLLFVATVARANTPNEPPDKKDPQKYAAEKIAELNSNEWLIRDAAARELLRLPIEVTLPLLQQEAADPRSLEVRDSVTRLLNKVSPNLTWQQVIAITARALSRHEGPGKLAALIDKVNGALTRNETVSLTNLEKQRLETDNELDANLNQLIAHQDDSVIDYVQKNIADKNEEVKDLAQVYKNALSRFADAGEPKAILVDTRRRSIADSSETINFIVSKNLEKVTEFYVIPLTYNGDAYRFIVDTDGRLCIRYGTSEITPHYPAADAINAVEGVTGVIDVNTLFAPHARLPNGVEAKDFNFPKLTFEIIHLSPATRQEKVNEFVRARVPGEKKYEHLNYVLTQYFQSLGRSMGGGTVSPSLQKALYSIDVNLTKHYIGPVHEAALSSK